jgi:hypothetical protein
VEIPFLTVVSGLPRSGTSMLMAALAAGGLSLLVDDRRPADEHNPRGYFEHARVKQLAEDASWLEQHRGQAVKIVYRLLYAMPPTLPARILFLRRDLREVVASQQAMLKQEEAFDWVRLFESELARVEAWLRGQHQLQVLYLEHGELLSRPGPEMARIATFLNISLKVEAMIASVDPALYRQRR